MALSWAASTHVTPARVIDIPFDALAHLSADGFALVTAEGEIVAWSDAAASLAGISRERAIGANMNALFLDSAALMSSNGDVATLIGVVGEKPIRYLRANAVALNDGYLLSFGPQRRFDRIEQLKGEILSTVSHELMTPIATIKAFAAALRDNSSEIAEQRDEYLRTIDEQADRLSHAVYDLLRAGRVDAEQLLARRERRSLDSLLDEALRELPAERARHPIERATRDIDVSGDPDLLRDMLVGVLRNAMTFSPEDSTIEVSALMFDGSTVISVRDHGIGIDKEHLPYIFERFYRAEQNMTASTGGIGLGLYIVRSLVRAHNGKISVDSVPDVGTVVTIVLPDRT